MVRIAVCVHNWVVATEIFLFPTLPGEMIQFDEHIFQMGWNHQLDNYKASLGGGFTYFFIFHPEKLGKISNLTSIFFRRVEITSRGIFQLDKLLHSAIIAFWSHVRRKALKFRLSQNSAAGRVMKLRMLLGWGFIYKELNLVVSNSTFGYQRVRFDKRMATSWFGSDLGP